MLEQSKHAEKLQVPLVVTQEGIARAVWIDLRHLTQYLRPLMEDGVVQERMAHVEGLRQRRKVYALTEPGKFAAARLRDKVKAEVIGVRRGKEAREMGVAEAVKEFGGQLSILEVLRRAGDAGVVDLGEVVSTATPMVERLSDAPSIGAFVGRAEELGLLMGRADRPRLFVIRGVAGIGKSTLAAQACQLQRGSRNLFWHRVRSWDTSQSVLTDMGDFLSLLGRPGLRSVLARGEAQRAPQVLREDLAGTQSFLVFDDAHEATAEVLALFRFLKEALADASEVRALVLTRRRLPFYDRRDVVLDGLVHEMDLRGLKPDDITAFLAGEHRTVQGGLPRELGGHPLLLQLLRSSPGAAPTAEVRRDVRRFMEETIYAELPDNERRMMKVASLYRVPMPREAFFPDPVLSHDVLLSLIDRSLMRPVGQDAFEAHDTIQQFFAAILTKAELEALSTFAVKQLRHLASRAQGEGDFVACIRYLSNAVELAPLGEERRDILEALGDTHERLGDLPASLIAYREALGPPGRAARARVHRKMASAFEVRGDIISASAEAEKALSALGSRPNEERGQLDLVRARTSTLSEDWKQAREQGESALKIFRRFEDVAGEAQALLALGNIEVNSPTGDPQLAQRYFGEALRLSQALGDLEFTAKGHVSLAHLFAYRFGNVEEAMDNIAAIEALPGVLADPEMRRSYLMLKGWFNLELRADYPAATAHFTEALALSQKTHNASTIVFARYGLAFVAYFEGHLEEARISFEECAAEMRTQGFLGFSVEALWMVAECCLFQEDLRGFRRVVAAFEEPALSDGVKSRAVLGHVLRGLDRLIAGDQEGCHAAFEEALQLAEQQFAVQEWPLLHFAHSFYGAALQAMGQEREGAAHVRKAKEALRAYGLQARLSLFPRAERELAVSLGRLSRLD